MSTGLSREYPISLYRDPREFEEDRSRWSPDDIQEIGPHVVRPMMIYRRGWEPCVYVFTIDPAKICRLTEVHGPYIPGVGIRSTTEFHDLFIKELH